MFKHFSLLLLKWETKKQDFNDIPNLLQKIFKITQNCSHWGRGHHLVTWTSTCCSRSGRCTPNRWTRRIRLRPSSLRAPDFADPEAAEIDLGLFLKRRGFWGEVVEVARPRGLQVFGEVGIRGFSKNKWQTERGKMSWKVGHCFL